MNRVILAYSQLPRQLPAASRAAWRTRLALGRALRLPTDALAQSRTLLGVALACRLLGAAVGRVLEPRELRYSANGKPYVPGLPEFSIAHAGGHVLCAVASAGAIGVDIEPLVASGALPRWAQVFDAQERAAGRNARAALGIWATKEAVLKAAGATLAGLAQVRVRGRRADFRGTHWHCRAPRLGARLVVRLATAQPVSSLRLCAVPLRDALGP